MSAKSFHKLLRWLAFLAGAALMAAHSAAADSKQALGADSALIFWHAQDRDQATFLGALIKEFEQQSGVRITLETGMELEQSLLTQVEAKKAPPLAMAPFDLVSLAKPLQLSPVPKAWLPRSLRPEDLAAVSMAGEVFGVPVLGGNHFLLYYNKKYVSQPAKSFAELREQAAKLAKAHPQVQALGMFYDNAYAFLAVYFTLLPAEQRRRDFPLATPACAAALAVYKSWSDDGLVPATCDYDCPTTDFYAGKFAYAINGDWALQETQRRLGDDFGVSTLPSLTGKVMASPRGGQALVFPQQALKGPQRDTLAKLVRYLTDQKTQIRWWQEAKRVPALPSLITSLSGGSKQHAMAPVLTAYQAGVPIQPSPRLAFVWPAVRKGLQLYLKNVKDAAGACKYMQRLADRQR